MIHQTYGHVTRKMRTGAVHRLGNLIAGPEADLGPDGYQFGTKRGGQEGRHDDQPK